MDANDGAMKVNGLGYITGKEEGGTMMAVALWGRRMRGDDHALKGRKKRGGGSSSFRYH